MSPRTLSSACPAAGVACACLWALLALGLGGTASAAAPVPTVRQADGQDEAAGPPERQAPRIRSIEVEGLARVGREALLRTLGLAEGEPLDQDALDEGIEAAWLAYRARVVAHYRPVDDPTAGFALDLLLQVQELPRDLEPRFVGHQDFDGEEVRNAAGIRAGEAVTLDQAPRIERRLVDAYESEGYYFVQVRTVVREGGVDPDTGAEIAPDLIFEIREGPRVRVKDVVVRGNDTLPDRRVFLLFKRGLKKLAGNELKGPWWFGWFAKDFVEQKLEADLLAMRQVYRDLGYLDAIVDVDELEFSRERDWVTIHLVVDEGPRYEVGSIAVEAVEPVPDPERPGEVTFRPVPLELSEADLLPLLELQPGTPFETATIRRDRGALTRRFGEEGFIAHPSLPRGDRMEWIEPVLVFDQERPVVHVTYRLVQGRRIFIREVRVRGNLYTQDRVIRRLITIDEGDRADPQEIEDSRRRIQGTGYFSDPRNVLEHREPDYLFQDTDDPAWKDLVYVVEEGQVLTFNISGGVSSNLGAFGIVSYSQRNFDISRLPSSPFAVVSEVAERKAFHGAGQELRIEASPGTRISFFNIFFREPDIFGLHRDRISLSLRAQKRLRIYRSHDEERESYGFEFGRQVGPDSSVYLGATFSQVDVDDIDPGGEPVLGDPLTVPRRLKDQEGSSDVNTLDFGYRFSSVDNRLDPRNGVKFQWANELALDAVGSDHEFWKSQFSLDFYDELGDEDTLDVRHRWHYELAGGVAAPFGDTERVPYSEAFFLGGQSNLRGFRFRGVGPNEKGFPVGGETMLYSSLEYRRPLVTATQPGTYREVETLHWGLFTDVGVLGVEDFDFEVDDYRASAGFLFGLSVPLPISFSIGFPLRKGDGDEEQRVGFYIGF